MLMCINAYEKHWLMTDLWQTLIKTGAHREGSPLRATLYDLPWRILEQKQVNQNCTKRTDHCLYWSNEPGDTRSKSYMNRIVPFVSHAVAAFPFEFSICILWSSYVWGEQRQWWWQWQFIFRHSCQYNIKDMNTMYNVQIVMVMNCDVTNLILRYTYELHFSSK